MNGGCRSVVGRRWVRRHCGELGGDRRQGNTRGSSLFHWGTLWNRLGRLEALGILGISSVGVKVMESWVLVVLIVDDYKKERWQVVEK